MASDNHWTSRHSLVSTLVRHNNAWQSNSARSSWLSCMTSCLKFQSTVSPFTVSHFHPCDHVSEGGFFNARLTFPKDYPNSPPKCRFTSEMWHPNGLLMEISVLEFPFLFGFDLTLSFHVQLSTVLSLCGWHCLHIDLA